MIVKTLSYEVRFILLTQAFVITAGISAHSQTQPNLPQAQKQVKFERGQSRVDSLAAVFRQPDYDLYFEAGELLIGEQKSAIAALIPLLSDTSYQKLFNTFGLNYPGSKKFYSCGQIVSYELDWVAVRAGWLIEEITFENFGYSNVQYLGQGTDDVNLSYLGDKDEFRLRLLDLAKNVRNWWAANKGSWTRIDAIKGALESADSARQVRTLTYLRFARTECDGLSAESFQARLLFAVQRLTISNDETIKEQAKLLINDGFSWMYRDFGKSQSR